MVNGYTYNDVDTGSYTTTLLLNKPYYTASPLFKNSSFANYFNNDTVSYSLLPIPSKRDLSVSLIPITVARPGYDLTYRLLYKNSGTDTVGISNISFSKHPHLNFLSASITPLSNANNTITWAVSNLKPEDTASIFIYMRVKTPPTANMFDTIISSAVINSTLNDVFLPDNTSTLMQILQSSCDPNDKTEVHEGSISQTKVLAGEYLQYMIRFQNTGNDTAFNVYIRDTLSSQLDWNSLQMIASSHPYYLTKNEAGQCQWTFQNINLVDSIRNETLSHGYIVFRIKVNPSIAINESIYNSASIYFDYNLPVLTNTTQTKITAEALPVSLLSFIAYRNGKENKLQWTTTMEINLTRFDIEKSTNSIDFANIGFHIAGTNSYTFVDANPSEGKNYYKLKLIDKDGSYTYSTIQMLDNNKRLSASIYPNPVKDQLNLQLNSESKQLTTISIMSLNGRKILQQEAELQLGNTLLSLRIPQLQNGSYLLKVETKDGNNLVLRFNKL